jgi:hypothetical protein
MEGVMPQEYLIEQLGKDGRWFIIGSDRTSGWAQHYMRGYRKLSPKGAFRVVEHPSRRLIVCEGGPALDAA